MKGGGRVTFNLCRARRLESEEEEEEEGDGGGGGGGDGGLVSHLRGSRCLSLSRCCFVQAAPPSLIYLL
ncbi:hypothetical protein E2C01_074933 [Portunus trituberculatus]|uniref:Uncharacterized protein n=1 Tax=Portunus trituberculatus TaxID=210409 RepID=A0A5B7IDP5_PORTR|nr:hypothetical protein [Portunus trituberculatus]